MVVNCEVSYNLSGTVTNMGLPVTGVTIKLYDYYPNECGLVKHLLAQEITPAKGTFNFDVCKGIYALEVVPGKNTRFACQVMENIKVTSNTVFDIVLKAGAILSGTVYDASHNIVSGCEVLVVSSEPTKVQLTQPADHQGNYSFSLMPGGYYVGARYASGGQPLAEIPFLYHTFAEVKMLKDMSYDISLPELLSLQGTVEDADGHPVKDVRVSVYADHALKPEKEYFPSVNCTSDENGKFECLLKSGSYNLKLEPPAGSLLAEKHVRAVLIREDSKQNYKLEKGHKFSGKILFQDKPVSNAVITVFGDTIDSTKTTDNEGRYSFSLTEDIYELCVLVRPNSLGSLSYPKLAPYLSEILLENDTELDIEMQEGIKVAGRVLDPARAARCGTLLSCYATSNRVYDEKAGICKRPLAVEITGVDGCFEFHLAPGQYWLVLNNQLSTGRLLSVGDDRDGRSLIIDDICLVTFEVVSDEDKPVPHCQISFEVFHALNSMQENPGEHPPLPVIDTDENGKCMVAVPAGIYTFGFHAPQEYGLSSRLVRQLSVNADLSRRVRLPANS